MAISFPSQESPKYCSECGAKLTIKIHQMGFDEETGKPLYWKEIKCPNVKKIFGMISPFSKCHWEQFDGSTGV